MRFAVALALAILSSATWAQTRLSLREPQPVDVRVVKADWHPDGSALVYAREEDQGYGIGTFRLGDLRGKVLLHLMEGDTYEYTWLAGTPCVIVDTYHNVDGGKLASVYLLNSKKGTAELLFAKQTKAPDDIKIDVATSPSLLHAIFDIREGEREYHMVLPINGGQLRPSPDIDEATTAGLRGPLWSSDGTAIYQKGGQIEVMLEASSIL